ncbi:myb family transcription factor PHL8-like [Primulina eburnea]|uniref:myb family transcription factor PHL8-like n=1 Tax=Primulina eburnea TaxID=1245227 RepID=UPI003C6C6C40
MPLQKDQTKEMNLVLSSDAKPRLKWTQELNQRFIDAVNELGGAEKATPKSLMRVMGIHGLTLYHLKSHLQKYRLGRSQQLQNCRQIKQENHHETQRNDHLITGMICDGAHQHINENLQIAETLQMQMEVQRKLHEQIEVQRHLQLRIEAQGKYLQTVLKRAQEALTGYSSCSIEVENAKAQLSELVSMVEYSGCQSSSISFLTQSEGLNNPRNASRKPFVHNRSSLESSVTSSESWDRMEETHCEVEGEKTNEGKRSSVELSLMEMHPTDKGGSTNECRSKKRSRTNTNEHDLLIDLNCKSLDNFDSSQEAIDLNCKGGELFNE